MDSRLSSWPRPSLRARPASAFIESYVPSLLDGNYLPAFGLARIVEELESLERAIGCAWCMDFGYWIGMSDGLDPNKVHDVPRWRDSTAYTDLERARRLSTTMR